MHNAESKYATNWNRALELIVIKKKEIIPIDLVIVQFGLWIKFDTGKLTLTSN